MERDVVAERRHAHRLVADALERDPERRAHEVPDEDVDEERVAERDVVEPVGWPTTSPIKPGMYRSMPAIGEKPPSFVTWPKK